MPTLLRLFLVTLLAGCASTPKNETPAPKNEALAPRNDVVFTETEVTFEAAGMSVAGTLTLPTGEGPFPAALLIAGSGPTDHDWNSPLLPGSNGSARLLAHALAEKGVATLRYDKRGSGRAALPKSITWADYLAEQKAGLVLLSKHGRVNAAALFVIGHSEGGAHALRLASERDVAPSGWVLLATAGRTLRDVVVDQVSAQLRAVNHADWETEVRSLANALDEIAAGREVAPVAVSKIPGIQQLVLAFQQPIAVSFTRELLAFDPTGAIANLSAPVLILNGDKDVQVHHERDAQALFEARPDAKLVIVPDADHVLKHEVRPAPTAAQAAEYNLDGRVLAPGVVEAIAGFIESTVKDAD